MEKFTDLEIVTVSKIYFKSYGKYEIMYFQEYILKATIRRKKILP